MTDDDKHKGIYRKYSVKRLGDIHRKHTHCDYFVLDWNHDRFAVPAARAYAEACKAEYPELAEALTKRASIEAVRWATVDSVRKPPLRFETPDPNDFHAHLESCLHCMFHPFDLCPIGLAELQRSLTAVDAAIIMKKHQANDANDIVKPPEIVEHEGKLAKRIYLCKLCAAKIKKLSDDNGGKLESLDLRWLCDPCRSMAKQIAIGETLP